MPVTKPIVANVTRKDGRRRRVTNRPLNSPTTAPTPRPTSAPSSQLPYSCSTLAADSAARATTEPIDRSISPAQRTNTVPTAITVIGADCTAILVRFERVRKYSVWVIAKYRNVTTKPRYTT